MRLSFTIVVSAVVMAAAVSAGINYQTKSGGGKGGGGGGKGGDCGKGGDGGKGGDCGGKGGDGHSKGGSGGNKHRPEDDRFHLQSDDGQYVFGYTAGNEGKAEIRDKEGTVTGYYSYVDGDGRVAFVNYIADKHGYRVLSNTGVPSASVTIVDDKGEHKGSGNDKKDFATVFAEFTKRIKDKVEKHSGQKIVDPTDGHGQYPVVDPTVYPTKETKPSKHEESGQFPDWDQARNAASQKPATKGGDEDGQGSNINDWNVVTTTETPSKPYFTTIYPTRRPEVPTKGGNQMGGYSDVVIPKDIKEIITEIVNTGTGTESTVIDDTENSSPVTRPESVVTDDDDVQMTTTLYNYDEPVKTTASVYRGDFQTTMRTPGVKGLEEYTTTAAQMTVAVTDDGVRTIAEEIPLGTEPVPTTGGPLQRGDTYARQPSATEYEPATVYQTTGASEDRWSGGAYTTVGSAVYDENAVADGSRATTFQPGRSVGDDAETSTIFGGRIRPFNGVTGIYDKDFDYRTLEPTERIGTTVNPGQTEAQEQEIIWPAIPQETVPQVLVPLDPYAEGTRPKGGGIKTEHINSRPARHYDSVDGLLQPPAAAEAVVAVNATSSTTTEAVTIAEATTAPPTIVKTDENATEFFYPKYFLIG